MVNPFILPVTSRREKRQLRGKSDSLMDDLEDPGLLGYSRNIHREGW